MIRQVDKLKWGGIGIFLLFCLSVSGQINLVLNPSFEQYTGTCTSATFNLGCKDSTITNWYTPNLGSPDWFNPCNPPLGNRVPNNDIGYQFARSGDSYAGIAINDNPVNGGYREYITGNFSVDMGTGKKYCVCFFVSFADSMDYATSALGAYISTSAICMGGDFYTLPFTPQIENPFTNPLTDKKNWVAISGEYNAIGGEQYITIGDFYNDIIAPYDSVGGGSITWAKDSLVGTTTYYYIDDVSVREIIQAYAGSDTEICNDGKAFIGKDTAVAGARYQWLPTTGLSSPNAAQTFASPTVTTTYTLTVVNDSMKGCNCPDSISRDSITISICPPLPNNLFIPTAFSPNGDGQNDILFAKGNNVANFNMAIYDRWGNKVYESNSINTGWDGIYGGKPMEAGTYVYYASGTYIDGTTFNKKGNVTLVR